MRLVTGVARGPVRTKTELDRIVTWVAGGCGAVAAAGGFFVGFVYTLDQGEPAGAPLFGALGLVIGALLGLLNSIAPVAVLAALNGRRWAAATPLRSAFAAVAGAAPICSVNLLTSDPNLAWLIFCMLATALPAAVATIGLDWRTTRSLPSTMRPSSALS